ncbi:hypothetical protein F4781DRAFT_437138 [Annulohypoxylon bovei var. microspora]|nr:hypothetical protein F4781DRAFT_437138 [Annulohypoxylon bovei var. microspora]
MSFTVTLSAAAQKVFNITELMENIFFHAQNGDVLFNAQRVSKRWKEIIEKSPKLQHKLFFRTIPRLSPISYREKNLTVASMVERFFNTRFRNGVLADADTCTSYTSLYSLTQLMSPEQQQLWLAPNASWKKMQIGSPPITKIQWQVRRPGDIDLPVGLPIVVAYLEFPGGLLMGDYYNLVLGTRGEHQINWPERWKQPHLSERPPPPSVVDAWHAHRLWEANRDDAILIVQTIDEPDPSIDFALSHYHLPHRSFWEETNLLEYHVNMKKLEVVGMDINEEMDAASWGYAERLVDNPSAMVEFLHAAQDSTNEWDNTYIIDLI